MHLTRQGNEESKNVVYILQFYLFIYLKYLYSVSVSCVGWLWPTYTAYRHSISDKCNTSMQQKAIHLLSSYTVLPVGKVDQKIWTKFHLQN